MDKTFPPEIDNLIKRIQPKAAFISEIEAIGILECENCGGVGTFCVFIAENGPFKTPSSPYGGKISHFDPTAGKNGGWWIGESYTFPCPICQDDKKPLSVSQYPTKKEIKKVFA